MSLKSFQIPFAGEKMYILEECFTMLAGEFWELNVTHHKVANIEKHCPRVLTSVKSINKVIFMLLFKLCLHLPTCPVTLVVKLVCVFCLL